MTDESRSRFDASAIIKTHLNNVKNYMTFQMDAYGRNASGRHVNGLQVTADMTSGVLWSDEEWFYMETGRGGLYSNPSRPRFPYDFQSIIKQWILDKGIPFDAIPYKRDGDHKYTAEERGLNRLSFFIARKIMRHGTALNRAGIREDIYSSIITRECNSIMQDSSLMLGAIIDNVNKKIDI